MYQRKFPLKPIQAYIYILSVVNKQIANSHLIPTDKCLLLFFYRVVETRSIALDESVILKQFSFNFIFKRIHRALHAAESRFLSNPDNLFLIKTS